MTVQTLYTAATGMQALETKLDVIANNMANVNTTAFKKDRANFEDLFYRQYRLPGAEDVDGNRTSTGIEVGLGVRVGSTQTNYEQGAFETTNNPLDLAIEGDGFFQIVDPNGDFLYTRSGNFGINANGQMVLGSAYNGYLEASGITIPPEATGHRDQHRRPGADSNTGFADAAKRRADSTGEVHQSRRPAEAGRQPVPRDRRLEHGPTRHAGPAGLRHDSARASWKRRTSSR